MDCRHWTEPDGICDLQHYRRYVPREEYHPAMRPFWNDMGMIRPEQWHWCAHYHGPQISKDVWVWPKATPRAAQVGAGSNISADPDQGTPGSARRDTGAERGQM